MVRFREFAAAIYTPERSSFSFLKRLAGPSLIVFHIGITSSLAGQVRRELGWWALAKAFLFGVECWIAVALLEHYFYRRRRRAMEKGQRGGEGTAA